MSEANRSLRVTGYYNMEKNNKRITTHISVTPCVSPFSVHFSRVKSGGGGVSGKPSLSVDEVNSRTKGIISIF